MKSTIRFEASHTSLDDLMNSKLSSGIKIKVLETECEYQNRDGADAKIRETLAKGGAAYGPVRC